ncbi:MFS transporter [Burkholderia sp. Ac-20345]|uniref:MFS transporter n=1 Tax=Burkholderia sp. Ac-20345 TaxID=2703891 RepID=UPI00197B8EFE|nr:MFS transporter [Burkholderia sp. Ac-20345]MBN3778652.1 MFS transporter [Burkholderia sp. Ac-20345]
MENLLVLLLALVWGFIFLDRLAIAFLTPELVNVFHMSNTQIGQIMLTTTLAYSASAISLTSYIDRKIGSRIGLAVLVILTSVFAGASAMSGTFSTLLVFRVLTGACEGPIFPLMMAILFRHSSPGRYAVNVGFVGAGVVIICLTLGPIAVTHIAAIFDWKAAFILSCLPSLLLGFAVFFFLRHDAIPGDEPEADEKSGGFRQRIADTVSTLLVRNVWLSVVVCTLTLSGMWMGYTFGPLYWVKIGNLSTEKMGSLASISGFFQIIWVIGIPIASNYIGRRAAAILFLGLAAAQMLSLYFVGPSTTTTTMYVLLGGVAGSATTLFMALLSVESVPPRLAATASSLIMGTGEILGGAVAPMVAGAYADRLGLPVVLFIGGACLAMGAVVSIFFKETRAPRRAKSSTALTASIK